MSPDTAEAENECPQRSKAATLLQRRRPCRCGRLRRFLISLTTVWPSFDLRNGSRRFQGPIRQEFRWCHRSSLRDYRAANLPRPTPGTFLSRTQPRKQTAASPSQQGDALAVRDRIGCARNRVRLPAQECQRSRCRGQSLRLVNTRARVAQTLCRLPLLCEMKPRTPRKSDGCSRDDARLVPNGSLANLPPPSADRRRWSCECDSLR